MSAAPSMAIRLAVPDDVAALARMRWDDSTEDGTQATQPYVAFTEGFTAFVRSALASDWWVIWVAEADGRVVAHIYLQVVDKVPRPGRFAARWAYAAAVYVVPKIRNTGVGSLLLRRVIDWAKQQELEFVLLWPSDRSVPFYQRAGFVRSPDALELHLDS